jgi:SAM-dependent methyltransferase
MSFCGNWLLPRLLDKAMRNHALDPYRLSTIGNARGLVLEVGVGSGVNLALYDRGVEGVFAIDPSAELLLLARQRMTDVSVPVSLFRASAEDLPFAKAVFDTGPVPRTSDSSLAALVDAVLEADRRRVSSRSENR